MRGEPGFSFSLLFLAKSQFLTENTDAKRLSPSPKPSCIWRSKVWQQAGLDEETGADDNSREVLSNAGTWQLGWGEQGGLSPPSSGKTPRPTRHCRGMAQLSLPL